MDGLVDVGGYRLATTRTGSGTPPVALVSGLGSGVRQWSGVLAALSPLTTVLAYARPGLEGSDPLPAALRVPHEPAWAADQLRDLLAALAVPARRVLVGHSVGALVAEAYAARWPEDVAGIVLVDPTYPPLDQELTRPLQVHVDAEDGIHFAWHDWEPLPVPGVPAVVVSSAVGRWLDLSGSETAAYYRPLTMAEMDRRWQGWQRDWAVRTGAAQVIARAGGHAVHQTSPALVALAVEAVVAAAREKRRVRLAAAAVSVAGGVLAGQ